MNPILVIIGTTSAFPMQKYLIRFGIPLLVQLSSNPWRRSVSIGVNILNFLLVGSSRMCVLLFSVPSLVNIVRPGSSIESGKDMAPSENKYSNPLLVFRLIFFAPFWYFHFSFFS